jgi:hypothetical protein
MSVCGKVFFLVMAGLTVPLICWAVQMIRLLVRLQRLSRRDGP